MRPVYHTVISAGFGAFLWGYFKSWPSALACLAGGFMIDLDHVVDYMMAKGRLTFHYGELFDYCAYDATGRLYLIFHSYEWLLLLWFLVIFYDLGIIWISFILGMTVHLLTDQIHNPLKPFGYFIFYRFLHHFKRDEILTQEYWRDVIHK